MKVAGFQFAIAWENVERNLAALDGAAAAAKAEGAHLLVLPEMFATGFSMNAELVAPHAARIRAAVGATAKATGLHILAGIAEPGPNRPRNAAALYGPDGSEIGAYHKIHPFSLAGEHKHYDGGTLLQTFEIKGVRVTPIVCYDLRFPELFRAAAEATDLFCVIANWPEVRAHAWRSLLVARAIENLAYVLGVNRTGEGDGLFYAGDSILLDPLGEAAVAPGSRSGVFCGEVDPRHVATVRGRLGFLKDRRPDVYAAIVSRR